jgi:hypothetical protein
MSTSSEKSSREVARSVWKILVALFWFHGPRRAPPVDFGNVWGGFPRVGISLSILMMDKEDDGQGGGWTGMMMDGDAGTA